MSSCSRHRVTGFTLIEVLLVVSLIAVLTAIAVPNYRTYVLRANRTEARAALLELAAAQERFYLQCHTYSGSLGSTTSCAPATLAFAATSERGLYAVTVTTADTDRLVRDGKRRQHGTSIRGQQCRTLRLTSQGVKSATSAAGAESGAECWNR